MAFRACCRTSVSLAAVLAAGSAFAPPAHEHDRLASLTHRF
jgi:hypothetical protein